MSDEAAVVLYTVDICPGCVTYVYQVQATSPRDAFADAITRWLAEVPSDYFIGVLEVDVHEAAHDAECDTEGEKA